MSAGIRRGALVGATLGALALTGSASGATLHGVVVQHNARAHSIVLALKHGRLVSVHARHIPAAGRVIVVQATRLRNGTFASHHIRATRHLRRHVRVHGVVTFVNRRRGMFTVSAGGASLLVRRHAARRAGAAEALPSVGDQVEVDAQIDDQGDLEDGGTQTTGTQTQNVEVEGTIQAIDTTANTLSISADDEDQSGQSVLVSVPSTIDISTFSVGQEVKLTVSVQPDGSFLLQGVSEDGSSHQANNPQDQQGCQGDGEGGDSCSGSGSGGGSQGGDGSGGGSGSQGGDGSGSGGGDTQGSGGSGSSGSGAVSNSAS